MPEARASVIGRFRRGFRFTQLTGVDLIVAEHLEHQHAHLGFVGPVIDGFPRREAP